jgi:hypothetical protein
VTGYPIHPDAVLDRIDLLKCEIDHLRSLNAAMLAALEAVAADLADDTSEAWVTPPVKRRALAAIQEART